MCTWPLVTTAGAILVALAVGVSAVTLGLSPARTATAVSIARPKPVSSPVHGRNGVALRAVVGLGDSVPEGFRCDCSPFVERVGAALQSAQRRSVSVRDLAVGGLTSGGLLAQVRQGQLGAPADQLTLITIGANDFDSGQLSSPGYRLPDKFAAYAPQLSALRDNVSALLSLLARPGHGPICVTGYWNVFLDGSVGRSLGAPYARDSDGLTLLVNAALRAVSVAHGVSYVDLYQPFKESAGADDSDLLAPDGDHPSSAGHAVIAEAVLAELTREHRFP